MKKLSTSLGLMLLLMLFTLTVKAQQTTIFPPHYQVDTRIDNMGYWQRCAELGLVPVQPMYKPIPAKYTGSKAFLKGVLVQDSPDVPVTTDATSTQSENSIFVDPTDKDKVLNSNNSTPNPSNGSVYGTSTYSTTDGGSTWSGTKLGPGTSNSGDPAACINMSGRWFEGYIDNAGGQSISYSDNQGTSWTVVKVGTGSTDKNHLWVDNSPTSSFPGYLYNGWMINNQISVSHSSNNGVTWSSPFSISSGTNAGSHNQGENFKTGPNGEAYCVWSVYDSWPSDEKALGFSKSLDGGVTWSTAVRALNNIRGTRNSGVGKNMRTNSFPSMACDLSNGARRGTLYVAWPNIGVPGVNTGSDIDVYMIKSTDQGATWSAPVKVNQDQSGLGKKHYLSWITCDQVTGTISVVFYDDRNVSGSQTEVYMAWSLDGGTTWQDMKISDVAFTPSPIPLMATQYMGDYLGITAFNGRNYPCWTDNRLGYCMTYVSPIDLIVPQAKVVYDANIMNDTIFGNGNNKMDFGEIELLGLKMKNTGTAQSDSVTVTLSSSDQYISFDDNSEYYGDFAIGQSKTILNGFKFNVSDSLPGLQLVPFEVASQDKNDSVTVSTFFLLSHGPALSINLLSVSDPAPGGNNNGRLDPGETATLYIQTENTGDYEAPDVISNLTTNNPYVTINSASYTIGTMASGQIVSAVFNITVSPAAYRGCAAQFYNTAHGGYQRATKEFILKIGLVVEDWETAGFHKFNWIQGGDSAWVIDPIVKWEGNYSAHSGAIAAGQTSVLKLSYNALYDDSISFYRKISTKGLSNYLRFFIDGNMVGYWSGNGNQNWLYISYPVLAGPHEFKWEYSKPFAAGTDQDKVWVDFIVFPPEFVVAAFAGSNSTICEGTNYQLQGLAMNYDSLNWMTSGTGTFSDPHILNPLYTPSQQDITTGSVVLTIHAYGQPNIDTTSSLTLTIVQQPSGSAGIDGNICAGNTFDLAASVAMNYGNLQWTTAGDGTFTDNSTLHPTYTPGTQDKQVGSVNLTLTVNPTSMECNSVVDDMTLLIVLPPSGSAGDDGDICSGNTFDLSTSVAANYDSLLWTTAGDGTFSDNSVMHPTYTPGNQDKQAASVQLTLTVKPTSTVCTAINDEMSLAVHALPIVNLGVDKTVFADSIVSLDATTAGASSYHWYPSGATTAVISVDTVSMGLGAQVISVEVTNSFGCIGSDTIKVTFNKNQEGIETLKNISFSIYPNPGDGHFMLEVNSYNKEVLNLSVLNVSGETVYTLPGLEVSGSFREKLDISQLSQGTYFVELSNEKGSILKKVVIRK